MKKLRWLRHISFIVILAVVFTLAGFDFFFARELEPGEGAGPDLWSLESSLVFIYANTYGATKQTVATLGKYALHDDDVSICLYLGRTCRMDPFDVLGLYKNGLPWKEVVKTLGLKLQNLIVDAKIESVNRPPARFRRINNEYRRWVKDPSYSMDLSDDDIRDLVQLRFVIQRYGMDPGKAMKQRDSGTPWSYIIISGGQ